MRASEIDLWRLTSRSRAHRVDHQDLLKIRCATEVKTGPAATLSLEAYYDGMKHRRGRSGQPSAGRSEH